MHAAHDPVLGDAPEITRKWGRLWSRPHFPLSLAGLALSAVVVLATFLNFIGLGSEGYANTYYAAAVRSMLLNWHNFFFVSFDPSGFVAVDKPPLGLWLQVASAKLFGFNGISLLLPQALAGVLSVIVLYALVSRRFGRASGVLAALALALTPVAVVDNRNNTSDSVLILLLLLAAWSVARAVETSRLRCLLVGAVFVGLGFNVKEIEALIILPPLLLLYGVGSPSGLLSRLWHVLLAGMLTLVVSFAWIVAVDLTPVSQRPYVSDSGTNSELSLALGYNGLGRLATGLLSHLPTIPFLHVKIDGSIVPGISMDIGGAGLFRLFRSAIGGQASWLLLVALIGLLVAFLLPGTRFQRRQERADLLFWGTWLLAAGTFFSIARFYHLYYLILLAPSVAALTGIGITRLWGEYRSSLAGPRPRLWQGWLLPAAVLGTGWAQFRLLQGYASWNAWLGPLVLGLCILAAIALILGRLGVRLAFAPDVIVHFDARLMLAATALGIASLLAAPSAFAAESIANGNGSAWLPQAGPSIGFGPGMGGPGGGQGPGQFGGPPGGQVTAGGTGSSSNSALNTPPVRGSGTGSRGFGPPGGMAGGAITFAGGETPRLDAGLVTYLERHRGHARYLVATATSTYASLFVIQTGQPVMDFGGYQGWDKILTLAQLKQLVAKGTIRYFLLDGSTSAGGPQGGALPGGVDSGLTTVNDGLISWVSTACTAVPTSRYATGTAQTRNAPTGGPGGAFGVQSPGQLYDCRQ